MLILLCSFVVIGHFLLYPINAFPSINQNQLQNNLRNTIQEVIPLEARDFYENLTRSDRQVLEKVLSKAPNYASVGEVLTDLRNGSNTLYDKAVQMVTNVRQTIAKLNPLARSFIDQSVEQIKNALGKGFSLDFVKTEVNQIVQRYKALDEDAKMELREAFPMVAAIVDNAIIQTLASGIFGIQNE